LPSIVIEARHFFTLHHITPVYPNGYRKNKRLFPCLLNALKAGSVAKRCDNRSKNDRISDTGWCLLWSWPIYSGKMRENKTVSTQYLCGETSRIIDQNIAFAEHKAIHGWRHANIEKQDDREPLIDFDRRLAACGDWCI
jgi:predicted NAD/FAD-dependent oxidoreductase